MLAAFVIWSAAAAVFLVIGMAAGRSQTPAGFWANAKAPAVRDIARYNRAVAKLWFVFAALFELLGVPLLFCQQNSPLALVSVLGTVALILAAMIAYTLLELKYRR